MKKKLPNLNFIQKLILIIVTVVVLFSLPVQSFAQTTPPAAPAGEWIEDSEVTFVGKTGVRAGDFLDWTLRNYSWLCVEKISENQCDNSNNPLLDFWVIIRNIVYAMIAMFVLATAFIIIVTRGQNITVMRFIPRFVFIIVLITLSFSLVQFIYQVGDIIQDFFLKVNGEYITTRNLLYIGFDYSFIGYRVAGIEYNESAFVSLLLVRLTAITYYVMTGVLLIRKIILWFFIIISPVFPLLIFYKPIRNTAKIWIGEFFRWLLYAPLFAIFLHGLVVVWQSQKSIPLAFNYDEVGTVVYPTAINILLGGPGQSIFYRSAQESNSVNLSDTFALYVVALLMLWVVIILPFILLKIFLDYISTISFENNMAVRQFMNKNIPFLSPKGPGGISPVPPSTPPSKPAGAGLARTLPFISHRPAGAALAPAQIRTESQASVKETSDIMRTANLSIPKMRDIARFETSQLSKNTTINNEVNQMNSNLTKIANPTVSTVQSDRQKFSSVRQQLMSQKQKGNPIAASILNASQIANSSTSSSQVQQTQSLASTVLSTTTTSDSRQTQLNQVNQTLAKIADPSKITSVTEKERFSQIKEKLMTEKQKGNPLAAAILETQEKVSQTTNESQKTQMESQLLDQMLDAEQKGNPLVSVVLSDMNLGVNVTIATREQQVESVTKTLEKIANPSVITDTYEREKVIKMKQQLTEEKQKGNTLATTILDASEKVSNATTTKEEKTTIENTVLDQLLAEEKKETAMVKKPATVTSPAAPKISKETTLPTVNRVQQVSLEDYEEVRKLWTENYQTIEPPAGLSGDQVDRREWIKNDIDKITQAITLLNSADPDKINQGMEMVANILPFLLIGGFSKTEVVAYLKAKMEAGKQVLTDISKKDEEEEGMMGREKHAQAEPKQMAQSAQRELTDDEGPKKPPSM